MFSRNPSNINTGLYPPRPNPSLYDSQATLSPAHNNASDLELSSYTSSPNAVSPSGTRTGGIRTPSPTPSEERELATAGAFDWKRLKNWRFWIRREWTWYYLLAVIITTVIALVTIFHTQIVTFLRPAANWMHGLPGGWAIPIAIMFIISFPPLFGHEIVAILCGLVWGLWIGFGIVAAGTFLGELGNFYAFKWCCRSRGEKLERTNIFYGCLAKVVRDGGFKVALITRLSAIPGHFSTAVFSTCGMGVIVFSIAAILSLPKQFMTVFLGVLLEQSANGTSTSPKNTAIKYSVIGITTLITIWALWYMYRAMGKVKVQVIYERRKARQANMLVSSPYTNNHFNYTDSSQVNLNPVNRTSFDDHANFDADSPGESYQRWDESGRAIGYVGDPNLVAPKPKKPANYMSPSERREMERRAERPQSEDIGYQYPMSEVGRDGRIVLRQQSDDDPSSENVHSTGYGVNVPRVANSPPPGNSRSGVPQRQNTVMSSESEYSQNSQQDPPPLPSMMQNPAPPRSPRHVAWQNSVATSGSDYSQDFQQPPLPSMQMTQSEPSPSRSPQDISNPVLNYNSMPGPAHQSASPYYQSSMSPSSQTTPNANVYQTTFESQMEEPRLYSPPPPSYHTAFNYR